MSLIMMDYRVRLHLTPPGCTSLSIVCAAMTAALHYEIKYRVAQSARRVIDPNGKHIPSVKDRTANLAWTHTPFLGKI